MMRLLQSLAGLAVIVATVLLAMPPAPAVSLAPVSPRLSMPETRTTAETKVIPQSPCLEGEVTVTGQGYRGASRATVWLTRIINVQDPDRMDLDSLPNAAKVADTQIDANGNFKAIFELNSRLEPVEGGGSIVLEPGNSCNIVVKIDGPFVAPIVGLRVAESNCPPLKTHLPQPLTLNLEPRFPCSGQIATLSGSGFEGPRATVAFGEIQHRFGHGPRHEADVAVGADGRWRLTFRPEDYYVHPEGYNYVSASDGATRRSIGLPVPFCNEPLRQALETPSIPLELIANGIIRLRRGGTRRQDAQMDLAVIRRPSDLEALALSHGLPSTIFSDLPPIDYARHIGVLVLERGPGLHWTVEIVSVASNKGRLTVFPVRWYTLDPISYDCVFTLVTIPRTDLPVALGSPAMAHWHQRESLIPGHLFPKRTFLYFDPYRPRRPPPQR